MEDEEREPTLTEIEAVMARAQDAEGNDRYLDAWRRELSEEDRKRSQENLAAFVDEVRAGLRE
jgi:hypothetical protein